MKTIVVSLSHTSKTMSSDGSVPHLRLRSCNVAVIGAGAGGIVAAKELSKEGHRVVVFEKQSRAGGTWIHDPEVESDPLGLDPSRTIVHSSLYDSLRTNLPRECMGYSDFPFVGKDGSFGDNRRYPGHKEVLFYLQDFVEKFGINELVRFECEVKLVEPVGDGNWKVKWESKKDGVFEGLFDAVVVCSGHFTTPRIAQIPGTNVWPGKHMHSHNYRVPEPFRDQVVVVVGCSASALDISIEVAGVAKEVHIASRSAKDGTFEKRAGYDNLWLHSMIQRVSEDGTVVFQDGHTLVADSILQCTGFKYDFPFLETDGIVTVDDNRVGPLYKHVFPPVLTPWLSFVGLPWLGIPFHISELQSKWIAFALSGRITLPSSEEMMEDVQAFYLSLEASDVPKRYTHKMLDSHLSYNDWLAAQCQVPASEEWRKQMFSEGLKKIVAEPGAWRDRNENDQWVMEANEDFKKNL